MYILVTIFILSIVMMLVMVSLKSKELETGERSAFLSAVAVRMDPWAGKFIEWSRVFRGEVISDIIRFIAAKVGLWTARALIHLRNFSSKLAAHLYHTSRKAEAGDPEAAHPSFFIKAIIEFRDKMREEKQDKLS
jgi:uncharacterized sodium:solute symporter family permease YidK